MGAKYLNYGGAGPTRVGAMLYADFPDRSISVEVEGAFPGTTRFSSFFTYDLWLNDPVVSFWTMSPIGVTAPGFQVIDPTMPAGFTPDRRRPALAVQVACPFLPSIPSWHRRRRRIRTRLGLPGCSPGSRRSTAMTIQGLRVLVIDDDLDAHFFAQLALEKVLPEGSTVEVVHSGNEGIAYMIGEGRFSDRTTYPFPR